MFYGNAQECTCICKEFISILDRILQNFHPKLLFDKTKYHFDKILRLFCVPWNLHKEKHFHFLTYFCTAPSIDAWSMAEMLGLYINEILFIYLFIYLPLVYPVLVRIYCLEKGKPWLLTLRKVNVSQGEER